MYKGGLKPVNNMVSLEYGNAEVSVIKPMENNSGWIVRLFNPTSKIITDVAKINIPDVEVYETNLEEKEQSKNLLSNNTVNVCIEPYKIKTFAVRKINKN